MITPALHQFLFANFPLWVAFRDPSHRLATPEARLAAQDIRRAVGIPMAGQIARALRGPVTTNTSACNGSRPCPLSPPTIPDATAPEVPTENYAWPFRRWRRGDRQ